MHKQDRFRLILELISNQPIATQQQLVRELKRRGVAVTQSSISRDIEELGISKAGGRYVRAAKTGADLKLNALEPAGPNLIVARCASGLASAVAVVIDAEEIPEIIGTIAGDDTVFIAIKGKAEQAEALRSIKALFGLN
jgi:transcriptional regulator of arginine metabolism